MSQLSKDLAMAFSGSIKLDLLPRLEKHAPGKHDQKTHAGGRYKNVILSEDSLRARYERDSYQFDIKAENPDWEEEEQAVNGYRDQDYDVINSYARASTTKDKQRVVREWAYGRESAETIQRKTELVDRAIDLAPRMEQNATLYRVMDTEILEKIKVGTVFKDKGFTSTTIVDLTSPSGKDMLDRLTNLNPVENKQKSVMQINNGPYTTGLFINGYLNEYTGSYAKELEMLLPREIELEYTGVENGVHMFDRLS